MSALGRERMFCSTIVMSALLPKADSRERELHVR